MSKEKGAAFITQLSSLRILANGAMSMNIKTPTLESDKDADLIRELHRLNNAVVAIAIVPENNKDAEIMDIPSPPKTDGRSPSQKVRNALWNAWNREGAEGDFEDYYNKMINQIIDWINKI